jgi:hypothetical protein
MYLYNAYFYFDMECVPGALGLLLWVHKMFFHLSVDENPYIPFFSLCVVLWAVAFQRVFIHAASRHHMLVNVFGSHD